VHYRTRKEGGVKRKEKKNKSTKGKKAGKENMGMEASTLAKIKWGGRRNSKVMAMVVVV